MNREMKDSGVEWLGQIPNSWSVQRLKNILIERKENNKPIKTEDILSLTKDRGVIPYSEKGAIGNKSKTDLTQYKLAYPGDIVLNSMNVIIGSVGLSKYFGAVSPVYYMLRPRFKKDFVEYYDLIFQTQVFQKSLIGYGNGIMEHRMRIPMNNLNDIKLPIPPSDQQQKIVTYLKNKTSEIDNIVEKTKQSIEELKAYKQSLITEVVTKGLNPDVPMKESGIDWVGSMPTTWERVALKRLTVVTNGREIKTEVSNNKDSIPVYGTGKKPFKYTDVPLLDGEYIIFGRKGTIGEPYRLNDRFWIVDTAYAAKNTQYSNLNYLYYLLTIFPWELFKTQTAIPSVVASEVIQTRVPYPDVEIQNEIVEFLDNRTRQIDNVINKKQQMIKELESYKQSLIYEYVTGKKEVE